MYSRTGIWSGTNELLPFSTRTPRVWGSELLLPPYQFFCLVAWFTPPCVLYMTYRTQNFCCRVFRVPEVLERLGYLQRHVMRSWEKQWVWTSWWSSPSHLPSLLLYACLKCQRIKLTIWRKFHLSFVKPSAEIGPTAINQHFIIPMDTKSKQNQTWTAFALELSLFCEVGRNIS